MPTITSVTARQILNSRGRPTIEATVMLSDGTVSTSSVPSGNQSNDQHEALELHDHIPTEYFGFGVSKAVELVNTEISTKLRGQDPLYQTKIDQTLVDLDGTKNKSRLGANSILAVSQAVMKAAAASLRLPLFVYVKEKYQLIDAYRIPSPIFNLINGGRHGGGTLDFQEFQLVPASHLPYSQALKIGVEMFMATEEVLQQKGALTTVGLEGGFAPNLAANTDALEILSEAAKIAGYTLSKDAFLGLDVGPSNFYKSGKYTIRDKTQPMNGKEFIKYLKNLHEQYRVFAFEDPLVPDAWSDWKFITAEMGDTAMILADDLIATNKTLLMKAIEEQACNALVIKPNRIGTITEAIEVASLAKQAGWHTIMSHRSSETTDDILADIAVGIGTDYVKFGAPSRGERVVKYNRLLRIEEILRASQTQPQTAKHTESSAMTAPSQSGNSPSTSPESPSTPPSPAQAPVATMPAVATPALEPMPAEPTPAPEPTTPEHIPNPAPETMPVTPSAAPTPAQPPVMPTQTPVMPAQTTPFTATEPANETTPTPPTATPPDSAQTPLQPVSSQVEPGLTTSEPMQPSYEPRQYIAPDPAQSSVTRPPAPQIPDSPQPAQPEPAPIAAAPAAPTPSVPPADLVLASPAEVFAEQEASPDRVFAARGQSPVLGELSPQQSQKQATTASTLLPQTPHQPAVNPPPQPSESAISDNLEEIQQNLNELVQLVDEDLVASEINPSPQTPPPVAPAVTNSTVNPSPASESGLPRPIPPSFAAPQAPPAPQSPPTPSTPTAPPTDSPTSQETGNPPSNPNFQPLQPPQPPSYPGATPLPPNE